MEARGEYRRARETRSRRCDDHRRKRCAIMSLRLATMNLPKDKDFAYEMNPMKIVSWPVGTWPLQEYNYLTGAKSVTALVLLMITMLIVHTEVYLDYGNAEKNLDAVVIIACGMLAISKVSCFRFRPAGLIANFFSAVEDYQELKGEDRRAIVKRHSHMGRMASANMLFFSYFSATLFSMVPMFAGDDDTTKSFNQTRKDRLNYPIPSECTLELLRVPGNLYALIYMGEYILLLVIAAGNLGSDSLFFGIVFHLCGQVEVLKLDFSRFIEDEEDSAKRLNILVNRHRHLLALAEHLNDTIGYILILQLFSSCLLICTTGFQFILSLHVHNVVMVIKTFIVMGTLLTQTFAYSYVGEYSKNQFGSVGYMAYCSDWYNAPCRISKNILFVLMKTQCPVHLRAGRFFVVNLETYMSILKTSMSYLSVLRVMIT
ncbi:odorant receptor 10-like [Halictus rubicundus]|uniref:odorant receptor 10-like n=1 Tax=Halictus rubicundus TaxID=77578 RepID=UPI004035305E